MPGQAQVVADFIQAGGPQQIEGCLAGIKHAGLNVGVVVGPGAGSRRAAHNSNPVAHQVAAHPDGHLLHIIGGGDRLGADEVSVTQGTHRKNLDVCILCQFRRGGVPPLSVGNGENLRHILEHIGGACNRQGVTEVCHGIEAAAQNHGSAGQNLFHTVRILAQFPIGIQLELQITIGTLGDLLVGLGHMLDPKAVGGLGGRDFEAHGAAEQMGGFLLGRFLRFCLNFRNGGVGLFCRGSATGAQGKDHGKCEKQSNNLFHVFSPFRIFSGGMSPLDGKIIVLFQEKVNKFLIMKLISFCHILALFARFFALLKISL